MVQECNGRFKGTGLWKLPTGAVNEEGILNDCFIFLNYSILCDIFLHTFGFHLQGEDICTAAIREVKEETRVRL